MKHAIVFSLLLAVAGSVAIAQVESLPTEHLEVARTTGGVRLTYQLAEPGPVRLVIFDLAGRPVKSWPVVQQPVGVHSVEWDGSNDNGRSAPAGSYFYRLTIARAKPVQLTARIALAR